MIERLKAFLQENYDIDVEGITEETELGNDLGLSSFQLVEMCADLEEEFNTEIKEESLSTIITIGDLMRELKND